MQKNLQVIQEDPQEEKQYLEKIFKNSEKYHDDTVLSPVLPQDSSKDQELVENLKKLGVNLHATEKKVINLQNKLSSKELSNFMMQKEKKKAANTLEVAQKVLILPNTSSNIPPTQLKESVQMNLVDIYSENVKLKAELEKLRGIIKGQANQIENLHLELQKCKKKEQNQSTEIKNEYFSSYQTPQHISNSQTNISSNIDEQKSFRNTQRSISKEENNYWNLKSMDLNVQLTKENQKLLEKGPFKHKQTFSDLIEVDVDSRRKPSTVKKRTQYLKDSDFYNPFQKASAIKNNLELQENLYYKKLNPSSKSESLPKLDAHQKNNPKIRKLTENY